MYRLIMEQPADQSTRVAILGEWGSGKTTIAEWVTQNAKSDGHIVISISPWAAQSLSDLGLQFAEAFYSTLDKAGIKLSGFDQIKRYSAWAANSASALADAHEIARAGFNFGTQFIRISDSDLARIRAQLGDKRILITIDDLDRTDPALLPKTFLALRELLDKPGFCFIIPFAYDIVSQALAEHHKAWGTGEGFLEKVIDYRFSLPPTTVEQRWELFIEELGQYFKCLPAERMKPLADILPDNPRKIKSIVRSLIALRHEINRHREDELNWRAMLLAAVIRFENELFYKRYIIKSIDNDQTELSRAVTRMLRRDELDKANNKEQEKLDKIMSDLSVNDPIAKSRLLELVQRWKKHIDSEPLERIRYSLRFFDEPEGFTWSEVDEITSAWSNTQDVNLVKPLLQAGSARVGYSESEALSEIIASLTADYGRLMENAASAMTVRELEKYIDEAVDRLGLLHALLLTQPMAEASMRLQAFGKVLDAAVYWTNFRTNAADKRARDAEWRILTQFVEVSGSQWLEYVTKLEVIDGSAFAARREFAKSAQKLVDQFQKRAAERVMEEFTRPGGLPDLFEFNSPAITKVVLVDTSSPLWQALGTEFDNLLRGACSNLNIQRNAHFFAGLLARNDLVNRGLSRETEAKLLNSPNAIRTIWSAAIAQEIQFRNLDETRQIRQGLVARGVADGLLLCPEWLHRGVMIPGMEGFP
jgi:ABC-type oligopeptide transport system ATPase subunit